MATGLNAQEAAEKTKAALTIKFENSPIKSFKVMQFNGFSFDQLAEVPVVDSMARVEVELSTV